MRSLSSGPEQAKLSGRGNAREVRICWGGGGVWGHAPQKFFGNFRRSEIDSGAFWDTCLSWQGTCYKFTIVYAC